MGSIPKRRFLDLDVGEVSLVDSPANEQEFVVVKRLEQEDDDMAAKQTDNTEQAAPEAAVTKGAEAAPAAAPATEKVEVKVEKNDAALAALAKGTELVESIAKATGAVKADEDEVDVEKMSPERKAFYKGLKMAGMKPDMMKKALADFDAEAAKTTKAETKPEATTKAEAPAAPAEVKKAEKPSADDEQEALVAKVLEGVQEAITKAKTFTPKRAETMKAALATLQKLMDDLSSTTATQPGGASFGESGVTAITKSIEELKEVLKGVTQQVEVVKSLSERVEKIEKVRQPSTSVDDDGGTDKVEKSKSIWTGVL